jgi:hypothetical protein
LSIKTKPHRGHGNTLRKDSIFKHTTYRITGFLDFFHRPVFSGV